MKVRTRPVSCDQVSIEHKDQFLSVMTHRQEIILSCGKKGHAWGAGLHELPAAIRTHNPTRIQAMNDQPNIDEAHVTRLFAKSERAEHKQPILRSTRPRWLRLTVGEELRADNRRRTRNKWLWRAFLVLTFIAGSLTASALKARFRSAEPEKPAERVLDGKARNPEASGARAQFNEEGRVISVSF